MHIGREDELAGKKDGERMKATGVKNALILNQEVGNPGLDQRIRSFKDGFEGPFRGCRFCRLRSISRSVSGL